MSDRIGIGYDIHKLVSGRKLVLGGVCVPYKKGLAGHSDADVLLHAIADALLGAVSAPDIGELFPDTDPAYKGMDSSLILKKAHQLINKDGYKIGNIDTVIIAQEPRLKDFKKEIRKSIAGILGIEEARVNIKAKTNEGLEAIGGKKAIAAYAVVLIIGG